MTLPHVLPAPPLVVQEPARCWSAAYDCWSQATKAQFNITPTSDRDRIVRWFESERATSTPLLTGAGRATDRGVRLMANIGLMKTRRMSGTQVNPTLLDGLLNDGYIYCAYYWQAGGGAQLGHAVVIYGTENGSILFMDPARSRGLVRENANFFAQRANRVVLGTSLLASLCSGLDQSIGRLR